MTLTATVRFVPAYFNKRCWTNIPARWTAEIHDGLPAGKFIYSEGCASRQDAINDLIAQAKAHGFTGKLKIVEG